VLIWRFEDNGVGISEEKIAVLLNENDESDKKTHIGLANVNQRIKLIYGEEYGLDITSRYGYGTKVTIRLPLNT